MHGWVPGRLCGYALSVGVVFRDISFGNTAFNGGPNQHGVPRESEFSC